VALSYVPSTAMWQELESFYDAVPRPSARTEYHGSLVLFVQRHIGGHPFYARPAHPARGTPTVEDVLAVRARQGELGVPESFEWVHEVTPSLLEVARRAGLNVLQAPLLVLDAAGLPPLDSRTRVLDDAPEVLGVVARLAFASPGTGPGPVGVAERDAALTGDPSAESRHRNAVGELPGQGVVSVGTAQRADDVVEIAGVATLPFARRKGLGAAVTVALARDALDRGATTVFLSAGSETIARVYEGVGFHRIGTACIAEP
jgi:ribosomal protein S18 acetylase RimI-like enzyme